jgi:hypothetical protein
MRDELNRALVKDFPHVFSYIYRKPSEPIEFWPFEIGDGWEPIIRKLAAKLEPLCAKTYATEEGAMRAIQVKEKFGTLRFYMSYQSDEIDEYIKEAERESASTCETCGRNAVIRSKGGWLYTACDECDK